MGRCTGSGLMPASSTRSKRPWKLTRGELQSARSNSTCSSRRRARALKGWPRASNSSAFQPMPSPARTRPPLSTSSSAYCLATSTVGRCGAIRMEVASSRRSVAPATKPSSTITSWKGLSCGCRAARCRSRWWARRRRCAWVQGL
jgi:hypothetical protein